jgi:hypothetical protein
MGARMHAGFESEIIIMVFSEKTYLKKNWGRI